MASITVYIQQYVVSHEPQGKLEKRKSGRQKDLIKIRNWIHKKEEMLSLWGSSSWEYIIRWVSQEMLCISLKPKEKFSCSQETVRGLYSKPDEFKSAGRKEKETGRRWIKEREIKKEWKGKKKVGTKDKQSAEIKRLYLHGFEGKLRRDLNIRTFFCGVSSRLIVKVLL